MKLTEYIGSQFGNPRGVIGKICCLCMNIINQAMYDGVAKTLCLKESSKVLDIGYGNGYLINKIYKNNHCYIDGIDISEDMKVKASKINERGIKAGKIQLEIGNCCKMPYEQFRFDVVTSINTIYFWPDTKKGLAEIYRVLKEGGVFKNAIYSKTWLERLAYTKKGFKLFEVEEIEDMAKSVGFSKVEILVIKNGFIISCYK